MTLLGSLSSGFAYLTMRKLGTHLDSTVTTFYFGLFSAIASFMVFSFAPGQALHEKITPLALLLLLATGLFGWIA
jgi:drug/metabolite transporter (DMT)-like permease